MTGFAINSGAVEYYDQKTGGSVNATLDTYTVSNGSTLVVRTDTYACPNHSSAFGSLDNVAYSGVGGEITIDPTYVRYISYDTGSGNSPAFGAAISKGGVSGVFLGVWANWLSEPVAPGAVIPVSGFIKIGGVTGGTFSAGALTGISANCLGADLQCWIEVRGADTASINVPRVGKITSVEAWFELGVTNGSRGQTIACPTTATVAGVFPCAWVETSAGSGIYEKFIGVGNQVPLSTHPTDGRCKWIWQTTSGIRIGSDGTNNVGYLPPAGCKIRIPAAILTCCTRSASGSGPRVLPNATLGTRQEFVTLSAGYIDLAGVVCHWYMNMTSAFFFRGKSCAFSDTLLLSNLASYSYVDDCIVSPTQAQVNTALVFSQNAAGGLISNSSFYRFSLAGTGNSSVSLTSSGNVTLSSVVAGTLTARANAQANALSASYLKNCTMVDCSVIGARMALSSGSAYQITGLRYADGYVDTTSALSQVAIDVSTGVDGAVIDGGGTIAANSHPYSGWINVNNGYNITVRNLGSFASPFECGTVNGMGRLASFGTSSDGMKLQRCYLQNTRTDLWSASSTVRKVRVDNCFSDYADAGVVTALDAIVRGCGTGNATTGQTAIYGSHWLDRFISSTAGVLEILCNEPTAASASQCQVVTGSPQFNSSGQILMTVAGQQVVWEMPYFALGHTALANSALSLVGANTGNLSYEFQYNSGVGYNGTWLAANAANFTAVGAIDPAVGIKIKVRVTCVTASASNALTNIRIATVTTSSAQSTNLYPLDTITLTLTGLVSGSDVVVRAAGTSTILASVDSNAGATWAYVYETPVAIDVDVIKPGYVLKPLLRNYTPSAQDSSLPVSQLLDRNYL